MSEAFLLTMARRPVAHSLVSAVVRFVAWTSFLLPASRLNLHPLRRLSFYVAEFAIRRGSYLTPPPLPSRVMNIFPYTIVFLLLGAGL